MAGVKPIPDNYPRLSPSLAIDGAGAAIDFYTGVLGATVRMRMDTPDGKVGHAELQFGDSVVMLADEFPEMGNLAPKSVGGTPVTLMLYVEDVDAVFAQALKAGAEEAPARGRPVLRRSLGWFRGSVRPPVVRSRRTSRTSPRTSSAVVPPRP